MSNLKIALLGGAAMVAGAVGAGAEDAAPLFKVGGVDIRPHVQNQFVYDDNIFLEHKTHTGVASADNHAGRDHDWIDVITPGLRLNAGDAAQRQAAYFDANYEAAITRFINHTGSDSVDHNAKIELGGKLNRLSLYASQALNSYSDSDVHNLAANGRVERKLWATKAGATYEVSEKTTTSLDLNQTISDYPATGFVSSVDRSANLWLDYQVLPKVKMGAGVGGGYLQVDGNALSHNPNTLYYNGQVRLDWQATEKLNVKVNGGLEERHLQDASAKDRLNVIFGVEGDWKIAERSMLVLGASRGSKASNAAGDLINEETTVSLTLKHGLLDNLTAQFEAGYTISHYSADTATVSKPGSIREDNYYFLKPSISYRFLERAQATAFYQYRRNESDLPGNANDFINNQIGIEVSYRF